MESLRYSGIPACTYAIQNSLVLVSYQNLPPLLFNLLNQTKLLWTALFVYVLLGKRFSNVQCFSMLLLSVAALSLSQDNEVIPTKDADFSSVFQVSSPSIRLGVIPILFASILSGLGAALTQRSMQIHSRDTALVTMELSLYGTCFVLLQKLFSSYIQNPALGDQTFSFTGWNTSTLLPVLCNAVGGLLVGVVTKYAGGVLKSFALVGGIICTALVESVAYQKQLSFETWVAALLVGVSLMLYSAFPHQDKIIRKTI
uniref:Uncharacterized protein AlNc14C19G2026 n=1 Tax=Albugo laibachii Nc14 TaxID=890382 RepID=F0W555_9STRA|nr:unknown putative [Albugo laibachii Nc14]|eukprot:CCA16246.1 unknown putative [Albugo laibachii Nc14]